MTKSKLETRLTRQIAARGEGDASGIAHGLLVKRGHIKPSGELTAAGKKRQDLGNAGRAKDRESKYSGGKKKPSDFKYDAKTNAATLKK
jgi:hypothetical protein